MKECGFHASVDNFHGEEVMYTIKIFFPARIEGDSEPPAPAEFAMVHVNATLEQFSDNLPSLRVPGGENAFQVALSKLLLPSAST